MAKYPGEWSDQGSPIRTVLASTTVIGGKSRQSADVRRVVYLASVRVRRVYGSLSTAGAITMSGSPP